MCGISAIIKPGLAADKTAITLMLDSISYRGPDDRKSTLLDGCHLGHNRLSIIDIEGGAQPMCDVTGRYHITFNGEIYNYQELRAELFKDGYRFHTKSDTEVIMLAYDKWGSECLHHLRGMFAFVLWDTRTRQAFCARDLFGEKPLYYCVSPQGALLVASELKAIIASGLVSPRLNYDAVDAFLALGYVPPHRCIYKNIQILPPAHYLVWESGKIVVQKYWSLQFNAKKIDVDEAAEQLLVLLKQAVRRQLVADVPTGAFLSGGLDSSSVVALLQTQSSSPVKTFSVGFGRYINELPYARLVAKQYRTEHHEIDLGEPDVARHFEHLGVVHDEPNSDLSNIPTYLISRYARRFVKVVLGGDGGDELFGGYNRYRYLVISERVSSSFLKWAILRIVARFLADRVTALTDYSVACGLAYKWSDVWLRGAMYNLHIKPERRKTLWGGQSVNVAIFNPNGSHFPPAEIQGLDRVFYYDLSSYIPGNIMVKIDRDSMANGLEVRSPLLDRDLVEFMLTLPACLKVDAKKTKITLRRAVSNLWPEPLRARDKQGFTFPVQVWLKREDMRVLTKKIFSPNSALRSLLPGLHTSQSNVFNYETWILLTLGVWLENQGVTLS